ncbi:hypothetical protein MIMGU_mgv1a0234021mg, partial [Erythranthe guttata]
GGAWFLPASKGLVEEHYYIKEYSKEEREKNMHAGNMKFAENCRSERGNREGSAVKPPHA